MKALHSLQGKFLYEKPLVLRYARWKSDLVSKAEGVLEEERAKRMSDARGRRKAPLQSTMEAQNSLNQIQNQDEFIVPNSVLFVQQLTEDCCSEQFLEQLFKQYPGFVEVRLVPGRQDIAFVEYENEYVANVAKVSLDGWKIPGQEEKSIRVTFAKK